MKQTNNYTVFCTFHDAPEHTYPGHPESPKRLQHISPWLNSPPYPEMVWLDYQTASDGAIRLIHPQKTLDYIKRLCAKGPHEFEPSPTFVTESSYQAALGAVGATLAISRRILTEGQGRGFAIVRPPGHHAEPDSPMGFCLLNNIAIVAADAVASGIDRVAIIDFDAHHGNGTEAAFWLTPEVGFLSLHEMNLYPGTGRLTSAKHALGRLINVPLPAFSNNTAYLQLFEQIVRPWLKRFKPGLLLVSAGFDAHFSDPLTTLLLDTSGFFQLSQMLTTMADEFCQSRVLFVLEGGYDSQALRDNIQACLAALCNRVDFPDNFGRAPHGRPEVTDLITQLRTHHSLLER